MTRLYGLEVVEDDALHRRAVAEGYALEDEDDLYGWLADKARDTGAWPACDCENRDLCCVAHRVVRSSAGELALQEVDPRTGVARPPEQRRLESEARRFGWQHASAQTWL